MPYPNELQARYNFQTHGSPIIISEFKNALLTGIVDFQTASKYENVVALNEAIRPLLNANVDRDYTKYTYYLFSTTDNKTHVIANQWINQATVVKTQNKDMVIKVLNISIDESERIRRVIASMGHDSLIIG